MAGEFPPVPPHMKSLNHYLKVASEHDGRDNVIAYWCRLHAVQTGLQIDKSSREATTLLLPLLDWLEAKKTKEWKDNESITNEQVAEAYIENYAIKIFDWAYSQDRSANFNKNVVKSYYTVGILIDVLTSVSKEELDETFQRQRKFARWRAAYIHNCLKNGETPEPPGGNESEDFISEFEQQGQDDQEGQGHFEQTSGSSSGGNIASTSWNQAPAPVHKPTPTIPVVAVSAPLIPVVKFKIPSMSDDFDGNAGQGQGPVALTPEQLATAQKYCKWAGSSLNFDDVAAAILSLERALKLLKTGVDEG